MNGSAESPSPSRDEVASPAGRSSAREPEVGNRPGRETLVRQAELVISQVLRGGVLLSAAIILCGVLLFYLRALSTPGWNGDVSVFPHSFGSVIQGLAHGDPFAVIMLGLLVLLATPVVRVAVSIVAFLLERDWRYVVITTLVLLILLLSFLLGKGGA